MSLTMFYLLLALGVLFGLWAIQKRRGDFYNFDIIDLVFLQTPAALYLFVVGTTARNVVLLLYGAAGHYPDLEGIWGLVNWLDSLAVLGAHIAVGLSATRVETDVYRAKVFGRSSSGGRGKFSSLRH